MASISFAPIPTDKKEFSAGEIVAGVITIKFKNKISIKGIKAKLVGIAENAFKRGKTTYNMKELPYLPTELSLLHGQNNADIVVEPRPYNFPVLFILPQNIPSSFKSRQFGRRGSVKYKLTATVITRKYRLNYNEEFDLHVNGVVDLNRCIGGPITYFVGTAPINSIVTEGTVPNLSNSEHSERVVEPDVERRIRINALLMPTEVTNQKSGAGLYDMHLVFKIAKTGFVAGENIIFETKMTTNKFSAQSYFQILQEVKYVFKKRTSRWLGGHEDIELEDNDCKIVFKYNGPVVDGRSTKVWSTADAEIKFPSLLPTNLGGGSIIKVNYCAQVVLKTCGAFKLIGSIPITVGTIPLADPPEAINDVRKIENETFAYTTLWDSVKYFIYGIIIVAILGGIVYAIVRARLREHNNDYSPK